MMGAKRPKGVGRILLEQLPGLSRELIRVGVGMRRKTVVLPWKLEFFVTYSCGSRCKTCLIWTRYEREPEKRKLELSASDFGKIAGSVGTSLRWLSFTGGEITDREDAADIIIAASDAAPRARVISSSTHGLAPEKTETLFAALAERYPDRAIMVTLSLDGLGETYEEIRGVPGSDTVFETHERLNRLSSRYPNLSSSFQATLSSGNFDETNELIAEMVKRARGNVITIANDSRVLTEGRIKAVDARNSEGLSGALEDAIAAMPVDGISGAFSQIYLRLMRSSLGDGEAPIPCTAGFSSLTISPYGEVLQCDRHDEPLGVLGAPDYDLPGLIAGAEYSGKLDNYRGCRECFTPCQAYPSMMQAPLKASFLALTPR